MKDCVSAAASCSRGCKCWQLYTDLNHYFLGSNRHLYHLLTDFLKDDCYSYFWKHDTQSWIVDKSSKKEKFRIKQFCVWRTSPLKTYPAGRPVDRWNHCIAASLLFKTYLKSYRTKYNIQGRNTIARRQGHYDVYVRCARCCTLAKEDGECDL